MLYEITVPQFIKMLKNLQNILDKGATFAEVKKIDMEVLLNSRLAPDQFNLIRQVQIACDSAKLGAARIAGFDTPPPVHEDIEKTLPELKRRIDDVIKYLEGIKSSDFAGAEQRKISQPRWEGKFLTGKEYALEYALPNLYFHVTTAYAILRHNGVEIGKKDYLGELPFKN